MYRSISKPPIPPLPLGKPRGVLLSWKILVKVPAVLPVRWSNAPPVRASKRVKSPTLQGKQNRLPLEINRIAYLWKQLSSAKFSATTNFLFSLSSLCALNKGIFHDIYNCIKRQQQKNPHGINKSNDPSTQLTCWSKELRNPFVSDRWQTFWQESQMPHRAGLISWLDGKLMHCKYFSLSYTKP